jgi:hypothetical protein
MNDDRTPPRARPSSREGRNRYDIVTVWAWLRGSWSARPSQPSPFAPLAQLDRASGYEPGGRTFESCRAHQLLKPFHIVTGPRPRVCEQSAADRFDGIPQRSVEHLRVHVQCRVDVGVTHQLRDHFAGNAPVMRPRRVRASERQPRRSRKPEPCACREHVSPQHVVRSDSSPNTRREHEPIRFGVLNARLPCLNQRERRARERDLPAAHFSLRRAEHSVVDCLADR